MKQKETVKIPFRFIVEGEMEVELNGLSPGAKKDIIGIHINDAKKKTCREILHWCDKGKIRIKDI